MKLIASLFLAAALTLVGCESPNQDYAKKHPELTAAQLQILKTGTIPDGTAVAGMTQEQIKLAMRVEPTQYTKIDGQDAWVYVQRKLTTMGLSTGNELQGSRRDYRSQKAFGEGESHAPEDQPQVKTIVYFQGDRATKADVTNGGL